MGFKAMSEHTGTKPLSIRRRCLGVLPRLCATGAQPQHLSMVDQAPAGPAHKNWTATAKMELHELLKTLPKYSYSLFGISIFVLAAVARMLSACVAGSGCAQLAKRHK